MDTLGHSVIRYRCRGCLHIGNQIRLIVAIGFGEVDFVANPVDLAFGGIARIRIVRRTNVATAWRSIVVLTPSQLAVDPYEVLNPNLPECCYRWQAREIGGGGFAVQC